MASIRELHYSLKGNSAYYFSTREYSREGKERTMAKMTRRAMLWATSAGVAAVTGVTALVAGQKLESANAAAPATTAVSTTGSVTAYIADAKSGNISLMFGENEVVVHNPALVQQILSAVR